MKKNPYLFSLLIGVVVALAFVGCQKDDAESEPSTEEANNYFKLSDSKRVEFAASNIYWNGVSFHFESEAYDFPHEWDPEHVGHFYWSKNLSQTYAKDYDEYGSAQIADVFCWAECNKSVRTVEGDTGWYVPSADEWEYLYEHHTYLYCNLVKSAGDTVFGLMVLPFGSKQFLKDGGSVTPSVRTTYNLTLADYRANLERHAVFFPGAYNRDCRTIASSRDGEYLSSSPLQSMSTAAECFNFYEYGISAWFMLGRSYGGSIRLVRNL